MLCMPGLGRPDGDYPHVGRHISRRTYARRLSPSDLRRTLPDLRPHAKRPLAGRHSAPAWRSSLDDQARAGSQHRREELSLQAQEKASQKRKAASCAPRKMKPDLVKLIEEKLTQEQWSPDQISGLLL